MKRRSVAWAVVATSVAVGLSMCILHRSLEAPLGTLFLGVGTVVTALGSGIGAVMLSRTGDVTVA